MALAPVREPSDHKGNRGSAVAMFLRPPPSGKVIGEDVGKVDGEVSGHVPPSIPDLLHVPGRLPRGLPWAAK
jgi:hypothetical protein